MSLITVANLQALTDKLGAIYDLSKPALGKIADAAAPVAGTVQKQAAEGLAIAVALGDYIPERDLSGGWYNFLGVSPAEGILIANGIAPLIGSLRIHCQQQGKAVDASINSLETFLVWYNGGGGAARFSSMCAPSFQDLYRAVLGTKLPAQGVICPAINPANGNASGMGTRAVGGAFVAGASPDLNTYAEVSLIALITTNFSGGSSPPTLTIAGIDDTGANTTTWTVSLSGNNPVAALATTLTPAILAANIWKRSTVALGSTTGIVAGSWLTVDSGANQEVVLVEVSTGPNLITAVFKKPHSAGAAVSTNTAIGLTPSVGTRRCRSISNITIGISGHVAGAVRIEGVQDRVAA